MIADARVSVSCAMHAYASITAAVTITIHGCITSLAVFVQLDHRSVVSTFTTELSRKLHEF